MNDKRRRANALMMKYYSGMIDEGAWRHASGDIAVFNTKYRRNIKSLVVQMEPIQAGSGDPSPDNIRPISGRTGATITRTGKNLLPNEATSGVYAGVTVTRNNDGSITLNGTATATTNCPIYGSSATDLKPFPYSDKPITLSGCPAGGSLSSYRLGGYLYKNGVYIGTGIITTGEPITRQNIDFNQIYFVIFIYAGYEYNNVTFYPMIEYGTEATEYEPYKGTTYPVSWETEAGTVYGGTVDVISGVLTVDKLYKRLTANDSVSVSTSPTFNRAALSFYETRGKTDGDFISSVCVTVPNTSGGYGSAPWQIWGSTVAPRCWISLPQTIATVEDFKAFLTTTPTDIVYEPATPLEYQLTPQQVQTLIGENVIWSDAGPVSVEYWS